MQDSTIDARQPDVQPGADDQGAIVTRATYQLFIVLVTLLALAIAFAYYLIPLPPTVDQVLYIVDSLVSVILLYDFFSEKGGQYRFVFPLERNLP